MVALELLKHYGAEHGLALPLTDAVTAQVQVLALRKGQAAFDVGRPCPRLFVVRSGLFKQVYARRDGSEWIKSFAEQGQLFACPQALAGKPATFASVAMEPSEVECVPFTALEALADSHAGWQKLLRIAFQRLAELKVARELDLLTLNAGEHYDRFVQQQPALAQRVAQKDVASYIGVTPVALNRLLRARRAG